MQVGKPTIHRTPSGAGLGRFESSESSLSSQQMTVSKKTMKSSNPNPLVSVVLPCRNEQGYIQACLQSALNQDPPEGGYEILVADGMSTDGTREYLQQMVK